MTTTSKPKDISVTTKADIKNQGIDIVHDIPRNLFSVLKGTKTSEELLKVSKDFTSCETCTERTFETLKKLTVLAEEMEFNRICILKSMSMSHLVCDQLVSINESLAKRTNSKIT